MSLPPLLARHRRLLLARLISNGIAQAIAAIAAALLVRFGFDELLVSVGTPPRGRLVAVGLGFVALAAVAASLRRREHIDAEALGQSYVHDLRLHLFRHLTRLPPRILQTRSRGGVMLRFVGDLSAMRQWISHGLARLVVSGLATTLAVGALLVIDPAIGSAVGAAMLIAGGAAAALGPAVRASTAAARRRRAQLAASVNDKIAALVVIQAFGQAARERGRFARQSELLKEAMITRAGSIGWLRAVAESSAVLATGAALVVGAVSSASSGAGPGSLIAAVAVTGFLAPRLRQLGRVWEYWNGAVVARRKLNQFLALGKRRARGRPAARLAAGTGRLELERVTLTGAFDNVSAVAEPGAQIAVVGPNGAGKSTLLAVAAGLVAPSSGRVLVDGQDLAACRSASVRRTFALVGPDLPLMRGTLAANLRYARPRISPKAMADVLALCGIDRLAAALPDGMETRLCDGGENLSVGQRCAVALARALLQQPRILLLDEADSHLDPQANGILDRVLATFEGTVILVTHQRRRVTQASEVWSLAGGRLVERGRAEELLVGDGPTARLFAPRLIAAAR